MLLFLVLTIRRNNKANSKKKDVIILEKGPTNGLDNTLLETEYSINFTTSKNIFCLSVHYNGSKIFFVSQWCKII